MHLAEDIKNFIRASTGNYGKVKLVLQRNRYFVESPYPNVLKRLLKVHLLAITPVSTTLPQGFSVSSLAGCFVRLRMLTMSKQAHPLREKMPEREIVFR